MVNNDLVVSDLGVCVAFHVPSGVSVSGSLVRLERLMGDVFSDDHYSLLTDNNEEQREVVYSIEHPLLNSYKDMMIFFGKLDRVFSVTKDMVPHFTQIREVNR